MQTKEFGSKSAADALEAQVESLELLIGEVSVLNDQINMCFKVDNKKSSKAYDVLQYWAKQLQTYLRNFTQEHLALQSRKLWLMLLQMRYRTKAKANEWIGDTSDLVDLAQRKNMLSAIEASLNLELKQVKLQMDELKQNYESIATADENWIASASMHGRLGVSIGDVKDNPSINALSQVLKRVSVPLRHPQELRHLSSLNSQLDHVSQRLVLQCRELAKQIVKSGHDHVEPVKWNKFKATLERADLLNKESADKLSMLLNAKITPCRPKIDKNQQS